jgi:hypothetical protein
VTGLGAGDRERLIWPWLVVAGVAVLAAAVLTLLVLQPFTEAARSVTLVPEVDGEWSQVTDDWTTQKYEMADLAMEYVYPGVDVSTATYVRADGTEVSIGTMVSTEGDDLEGVVADLERSVYGLVIAQLPQATEATDPGPLGGRMTCGTVILRNGARLGCAWADRTTAGAVAIPLPRDADVEVDLAALTREFREAVTRVP